MKYLARLGAVLFLTIAVIGTPVASRAGTDYDDSQSNPLRVTAYLLNPFGVALEWVIFRPFHFLVSATPVQAYIFGHRPHPPLIDDSWGITDYGVAQRVPPWNAAPSQKVTAIDPTAGKAVTKEALAEKPAANEAPDVAENPGETQTPNPDQTHWARAAISE